MPTNLNALIRYKTINNCLFGGRRRWSMDELINACSEALGETRGRYEPISERTLRDDIRVMRSDILGFNAPIEQLKGLYFYSDPDYSIMTISISDSALADQIILLLQELRSEINHPELEIILERLIKMTGRKHVIETLKDEFKPEDKTIPARKISKFPLKEPSPAKITLERFHEPSKGSEPEISYSMEPIPDISWGNIIGLIS